MEKLRFVTALLLVGLNAALAQEEQINFAIGGKLNLRPSVSGRISSLLWKHNGNLVTEWVDGLFDEVYGSFKGRTITNKTTGWLEITGMTEHDAGLYTVEINNRDQGLRYNAVSIKEEPEEPEVAQEEQAYFVIGGKLLLRPSVSGHINNILWKHNGNLVTEWEEGLIDEVYGTFKSRTIINETTGWLEITGMTEADAGVYTVEINKKDQVPRYNAVSIKEVTKPVLVRPAPCSPDSETCTLTCDGETEGAEPVDYNWNLGDGKWRKLTKVVTITKRHAVCANTFTCQMKNPVSRRESEPQDNPFSREKRELTFFARAMCTIINNRYFPNSTNLNSS